MAHYYQKRELVFIRKLNAESPKEKTPKTLPSLFYRIMLNERYKVLLIAANKLNSQGYFKSSILLSLRPIVNFQLRLIV